MSATPDGGTFPPGRPKGKSTPAGGSDPRSGGARGPSDSKPWLIDFVLLAAIWGASFMFMRIGARELGAFATAGVRVGIAALHQVLHARRV